MLSIQLPLNGVEMDILSLIPIILSLNKFKKSLLTSIFMREEENMGICKRCDHGSSSMSQLTSILYFLVSKRFSMSIWQSYPLSIM